MGVREGMRGGWNEDKRGGYIMLWPIPDLELST